MQRVEITTKGHMDEHWSEWFEGLTIEHTERGETVLRGLVADQAALHGLLAKLRDLGLAITRVNAAEIED